MLVLVFVLLLSNSYSFSSDYQEQEDSLIKVDSLIITFINLSYRPQHKFGVQEVKYLNIPGRHVYFFDDQEIIKGFQKRRLSKNNFIHDKKAIHGVIVFEVYYADNSMDTILMDCAGRCIINGEEYISYIDLNDWFKDYFKLQEVRCRP